MMVYAKLTCKRLLAIVNMMFNDCLMMKCVHEKGINLE